MNWLYSIKMKQFVLNINVKHFLYPFLSEKAQIKNQLLSYFIEQRKTFLEKLWEENDKEEEKEEYIEEEIEEEVEEEIEDNKKQDKKESNDSLKELVHPLLDNKVNIAQKDNKKEFEFEDDSYEQPKPIIVSKKEQEDTLKSNSNVELNLSQEGSAIEKEEEVNLFLPTESDIEEEGRKQTDVKELEEVQFGNIAVIAQRFNKIDTLDDWKKYIRDLIHIKEK